jgi:hypothetical protein
MSNQENEHNGPAEADAACLRLAIEHRFDRIEIEGTMICQPQLIAMHIGDCHVRFLWRGVRGQAVAKWVWAAT